MKTFKKLVMLLLVIVIVCFMGCSNKGKSNTPSMSTSNNTVSSGEKNVSSQKNYINTKYLFRVSYPGQWADAVESEVKDGALLYYNDDNDVRVFADKADDGYIEAQREQAKSENKKVNSITSNDGLNGILITGDDKGKKLTHVIYVDKGNHYDFYALVKDDFNKSNEKGFLEIAKSIKMLN